MGFTDFLGNIGKAVVDVAADFVGNMAGVADEDRGLIDLQLGTRVFNDVPSKVCNSAFVSAISYISLTTLNV